MFLSYEISGFYTKEKEKEFNWKNHASNFQKIILLFTNLWQQNIFCKNAK